MAVQTLLKGLYNKSVSSFSLLFLCILLASFCLKKSSEECSSSGNSSQILMETFLMTIVTAGYFGTSTCAQPDFCFLAWQLTLGGKFYYQQSQVPSYVYLYILFLTKIKMASYISEWTCQPRLHQLFYSEQGKQFLYISYMLLKR